MKSIITKTAKIKMALARKGEAGLPPIAGIAIGDGAADGDGGLLEAMETDTRLKNELIRRTYCKCEKISDSSYRYRIELGEDELVGKTINEAALYDSDGDLLAIRVFSGLKKDEGMEMAFEYDDKF